jgi:hypothetical protein
MLRSLLAAAAFSTVLTVPLCGQQTKVVPAGMDHVEGPAVFTYPFGRVDAAVQLLYDADQITSGTAVITGIRFRQSRLTGAAQIHPGYTKAYRVTAYTVSTTAANMVADLLANVGGAVGTVVFHGNLTLPPVTNIATFPAPFGIQIPFSTPAVFDSAAGNLLLLIETADALAVPSGSYRIDAVTFRNDTVTGIATELDSQGCSAHAPVLGLAANAPQAVVGGAIVETVSEPAPGSFPAVLVGLSLGVQPLDLSTIGLPGCTSWLAPFAFQIAAAAPGGGYPSVAWPLPNVAELEGVACFGQALGLPASGLLGDASVSNGIAVRIGNASFPPQRAMMAFRGAGAWSIGQTGENVAVVEFEGAF